MADHMQSNLGKFANSLQSQLVGWEAFMDRQLQRMHQLQLVIQSEQEDCKENIYFAKQQIAGLQSMAGELAASQGIATLEQAPPKQAEPAPTQEDEEDEVPPSDAGKLPASTIPHVLTNAENSSYDNRCKRYRDLENILRAIISFPSNAQLQKYEVKTNSQSYMDVDKLLEHPDGGDDKSFKLVLKENHDSMWSLLIRLDEWLYKWRKSTLHVTSRDAFNGLKDQRKSLCDIVCWSNSFILEIPVALNKTQASQEYLIRQNWCETIGVENSGRPAGVVLEILQPGYMKRNSVGEYEYLLAVKLTIAIDPIPKGHR